MNPSQKQAVLWESAEGGAVRCRLCHHHCRITEGQEGLCGARKNVGGTLYSLSYDCVCAANSDPIEKKPLYHFQPGSRSFSIAAPGCNFNCDFCQNWQISQAGEKDRPYGRAIDPRDIVQSAVHANCNSIAYTYTEPTIFIELAEACAHLGKEQGLANVFVSNGYMTTEAIDYMAGWLDGINVDLKAFSDFFYRKHCMASLEGVLETIRHIARNTHIWMELTTLLIPGLNDSADELKRMTEWIVKEAGPHIPWHVSRFYPQHRLLDVEATPEESIRSACEIGKAAGLQFVYVGNLPGNAGESTRCPGCNALLIERKGYAVRIRDLDDGRCRRCGRMIEGFQLP
ncbi:MAG: AmmeMemoRadiSam system radical SAM enzyme [Phycisphaerae bacterium]|nr:AmmeMemoRadiSam system radical SAM enzyme [Phycisphaerae bacterium]